ncbi:hypothetical protein WJX82_006222 [Trebouxia sp. C0006]
MHQDATSDHCCQRLGHIFKALQAVMQAFIAAIDIVYRPLFTCPICAEYVYTIIIHGKAIGVHRNQAHQCCIADGAATFNVECLHAQVVASQ